MRRIRRFVRAAMRDYVAFRNTWTGTLFYLGMLVVLLGVVAHAWWELGVGFVWATFVFAWDVFMEHHRKCRMTRGER